MKNKNGYTILELLIVMLIMGAGIILTITGVSHAFSDNKTEAYETEINYLLDMAKAYGEEVKEEISDATNGITVTVETLIEKGYVLANSDGKIKDPRNSNQFLNNTRIKIMVDGENIKTEVVE